jgi:two-component system, OmpR family, response regulator
MRTLIIEDDAETAAFIAAGLRSRGHEPTLAADGREGFEIAAQETFDVIILDRMLPALDGCLLSLCSARKAFRPQCCS